MKYATVVVKVQLELEAPVAGVFGPDWTLDKLQKEGREASQDAVRKLLQLAHENGLVVRVKNIYGGSTIHFSE